MANVIFKVGTSKQYEAIQPKDQNTLYWLTDTQQVFKGDTLFGVGANATEALAGLLSAEDKKRLDKLVEGGLLELTSADGSILIVPGEGSKDISVAISKDEGNKLTLKADGLYADGASADEMPEYTIEKMNDAEDGYSATYRLKKMVGEESEYVGAEINIPKDLVVQSGSVGKVTVEGQPYPEAKVGDEYIDLVLNDDESTHIYIPFGDIFDPYTAGIGIEIDSGVISVKLNKEESNGLSVTDSGLALALATKDTAGALSAVDKKFLDSVPAVYEKVKYMATNMLPGARFDVDGKEIRVMFPKDAKFVKPTGTAEGRDPDSYYCGIRVYAPSDEVDGFKEALSETVPEDTEMEHFPGSSSGIDEYGRKYDVCWFPVAKCDAEGNWTYYGASSTPGSYVGWYHTIEWYKGQECVGSETVRINLTNEGSHNSLKKFLGKDNTPAALVWDEM